MKKVTRKFVESYGGKLPAFIWPGGYPVYYITPEGDVFCADCANKGDDILELAYNVNWEDKELYCVMGCKIPSAYEENEE